MPIARREKEGRGAEEERPWAHRSLLSRSSPRRSPRGGTHPGHAAAPRAGVHEPPDAFLREHGPDLLADGPPEGMERTGCIVPTAPQTDHAFPRETEPVDRFHDFEQFDLLGRPGQPDPPPGSLEREEQTTGRQPAEDLGEEGSRDLRSPGDLLHCDVAAGRLVREEEKPLDPVLASPRENHDFLQLRPVQHTKDSFVLNYPGGDAVSTRNDLSAHGKSPWH